MYISDGDGSNRLAKLMWRRQSLLNQIVSLLKNRGYVTNSAEGRTGTFIRETDDKIYLVILCAYQDKDSITNYEKLRLSNEYRLVTHYKKKVESLFIIVNRDGIFDDTLTDIVSELPNTWLLAGDTGKIYIFENQPTDFDDGLNEYLESNLFRIRMDEKNDDSIKLTPVNTALVLINIIVFISVIIINGNPFASYDADVMLKMGASSYNSFVSGRWYEIITAMFLHFGVSHLFNNMLLLVYIGCELEKRIGSFVYAIIYLGSGIVGNAASLLYYSRVGEADVVSAGASGAIFGVMGCLAVYLLINPSKNRNLTTRRLIIMALLTIYYGFSNVGVDNAAHIGGFCFGIFGGFLLSKILHYDKIKLTKFYGREGSFIRRK